MVKDDTLDTAMTGLAASINSGTGDPAVFAEFEPRLQVIKLVARMPGTDGNNIALAVSGSTNATFTITASGSTLQGGENATIIAPGTLITLLGHNLADAAASADLSQDHLAARLGRRAALLRRQPVSLAVRIAHPDQRPDALRVSGFEQYQLLRADPACRRAAWWPPRPSLSRWTSRIRESSLLKAKSRARRLRITPPATPPAPSPWTAALRRATSGTITIGDRSYTYTVQAGDTLTSVRDAFVALINANTEEEVVAVPGAGIHRIQLRAKVPGPEGNGITFGATTDMGDNANLFLILTNLSNTLCCANRAGSSRDAGQSSRARRDDSGLRDRSGNRGAGRGDRRPRIPAQSIRVRR